MQQEKLNICIKKIIIVFKLAYFTCSNFYKFANIPKKMRRIAIFAMYCLLFICRADAATRDGNVAVRAKNPAAKTSQRVSTINARTNKNPAPVSSRASKTTARKTAPARTATTRQTPVSLDTSQQTITPVVQRVSARSASSQVDTTQTRTGAEYERCKNSYFTCMDQFCGLKNDDYRRCSCSNRVFDLMDSRKVLNEAGDKLTVFNENLTVVGMTAAQASAMKTASDGEKALTDDKSASKALLQAIMNSIKGKDTNVGGKFTELNSINLSFDTANAFGNMDAGQAIATYNGQNLYNAIYPQCRDAVRTDCNNASLQRAVTAYLMAVEQDCNTVQTAIENKQKQMKSTIREGSAMLDLARVENRQKHNSSDFTTCLNDVEKAILSEQVCGAGYHKCLDNGEYIDLTTGKPIAGVADFYKLEELLTFSSGVEAANQKLSKIINNRKFVQNFENKTKKFASDALDKCVEIADDVWAEYLDKAMLSIYYAQKSKVAEIRQGCFDFVSACYMNGDKSMTDAMKELLDDSGLSIQPDRVALNSAMCTDYVQSCNNMFNDNIISQYIERRQETDVLTACRAVAKQCFDSFGGSGYENFYYPYSGIFTPNVGNAPDWFTLYEVISKERYDIISNESSDEYDPKHTEFFTNESVLNGGRVRYVSTCAKQLKNIESCNDPVIIETAFGGLDRMYVYEDVSADGKKRTIVGKKPNKEGVSYSEMYGMYSAKEHEFSDRRLRPTGVATEVYNQVIDILTTQCSNVQGLFVERQYINTNYDPTNLCKAQFDFGEGSLIEYYYGVAYNEDMCPRNYTLSVDTPSWGTCSCWENGARRSKNGKSAKCLAVLPQRKGAEESLCTYAAPDPELVNDETAWCTRAIFSSDNQVCPVRYKTQDNKQYQIPDKATCDTVIGSDTEIPEGVSM